MHWCLFRESVLINFVHLNFTPSIVIMAAQLEPFRQMDSHLEKQVDSLPSMNRDRF